MIFAIRSQKHRKYRGFGLPRHIRHRYLLGFFLRKSKQKTKTPPIWWFSATMRLRKSCRGNNNNNNNHHHNHNHDHNNNNNNNNNNHNNNNNKKVQTTRYKQTHRRKQKVYPIQTESATQKATATSKQPGTERADTGTASVSDEVIEKSRNGS